MTLKKPAQQKRASQPRNVAKTRQFGKETLWVLDALYERSAAQIVAAVERLLAHAELTLQDADVVAAALGQFRGKPTLGFSDCLVLEVARKSGHLPLGSFDHRLGKVAGAHRID